MFEVGVENSFDFFSDDYLGLFARSRATAFQHPLWLDRLYRNLAPNVGAEPLVVTVRRREDGRLAMLLPLVRVRRSMLRVVEFADLNVSDYAAPVADESFGQIAGDRHACERLRALLRPYDLIRIRKLDGEAPPLEQMLGVCERLPMGVSAHAVRLYGPYSRWRVENMDASYRRELDKKRRKINRHGVLRFDQARTPEAIKEGLAALRRFRKARYGDLDLLQQPPHFDFYVEIALRGCETGFARTYSLTLDGEPIGGAWGLSHGGSFLLLLSGFEQGLHRKKSVGALTFESLAEDCIARQERVLDFTIGDEPYKRQFGAEPSRLDAIRGAGTTPGLLANLVADRAPWVLNVLRGDSARPQRRRASGRSGGP